MAQTFQEGSLTIEAPDHVTVHQPDRDTTSCHGLKLPDFVFDDSGRLVVLELKDPQAPNDAYAARPGSKINDNFVPKARGAYTFLGLKMANASPLEYFVVINWNIPKATLGPASQLLLQRVLNEPGWAWPLRYVSQARIMTVADWNKLFPNYSIS